MLLVVQSAVAETFGANVATKRRERGWSQAQLAQRFGEALGRSVDATTITRLEGGTRPTPLDEAATLSELLGSTIDEMLRRPDEVQVLSEIVRLGVNVRAARSRLSEAAVVFESAREEFGSAVRRAKALGVTVEPELRSGTTEGAREVISTTLKRRANTTTLETFGIQPKD